MNVNEIVQDARTSLIDADRLADALPREHQAAIRALISGLDGLAQAIAESHRDLASRIVSTEAHIPRQRPGQPPLAVGME